MRWAIGKSTKPVGGAGVSGLKTGQVDVFLGNWMPAQAPVIGKFTADGAIKVLGSNLPAARFTLAVPDYVAAAG